MSHKTRGRIRMLLTVPSAVVLVFGASQALASPPAPSRAPSCDGFCEANWEFCDANPTNYNCRYCGC